MALCSHFWVLCFKSWWDLHWLVKFLNHCTEGKSVESQRWQLFSLEIWVQCISCASIPGTCSWSKNTSWKFLFLTLAWARISTSILECSSWILVLNGICPPTLMIGLVSFPLWGFPRSSTDPYHPRASLDRLYLHIFLILCSQCGSWTLLTLFIFIHLWGII